MKNETIRKLKDLKNTLHDKDYVKIYSELCDILVYHDTRGNDNISLYDEFEEMYDFVTDDELEDAGIIENEFKKGGLSRLRYFINNTYDDSIYVINGYGNLKNVNDDIFKSAIDDMLSLLESENDL